MIICKIFNLNFQGCVMENENDLIMNIEFFFVSVVFYDFRDSRKIFVDFYVDFNYVVVRQMFLGVFVVLENGNIDIIMLR